MENTPAKQKLSPKFFFISLGVLVSLVTSVTSLLSLVFASLDKWFPDVLNATYSYGYSSYDYSGMRSALSTLVIFFPLLLILSAAWVKLVQKTLGHADEVVKKWMLYLVLFLASLAIVIDLVTLVQYFVSGEITIRFVLKAVSLIVVAGIAGVYYFKEISAEPMKSWVRVLLAFAASALVLAAITGSFFVMGSPFKQRTLRLDAQRTSDLQSIQSQVINYWQQKSALPSTLSDLANPLSGFLLPVDPEFESGKTYEYTKTGDRSFELCATFSLPMPKGWQEYSSGGIVAPMPAVVSTQGVSSPGYPGAGSNESWDHQSGRTCYSRTIDPDMYPPFPKPLQQ